MAVGHDETATPPVASTDNAKASSRTGRHRCLGKTLTKRAMVLTTVSRPFAVADMRAARGCPFAIVRRHARAEQPSTPVPQPVSRHVYPRRGCSRTILAGPLPRSVWSRAPSRPPQAPVLICAAATGPPGLGLRGSIAATPVAPSSPPVVAVSRCADAGRPEDDRAGATSSAKSTWRDRHAPGSGRGAEPGRCAS